VFRELHRVLRDDGLIWLNLGDKRANDAKLRTGLAPRTLAGVPWRVALALINDVDERGRPHWALLNEVIWHKLEALPEPARDRLTLDHEHLFLFAKADARHYFDRDAIAEPASLLSRPRGTGRTPKALKAPRETRANGRFGGATNRRVATRNARTVWPLRNERSHSPHYAWFPAELAARCLLASTAPQACGACATPYRRQVREEIDNQDVIHRITTGWAPGCRCGVAHTQPCRVLDPFAGSGTVLAVAEQHEGVATGIDLSPAYEELIDERTSVVQLALGGMW
jgi:DNA modification methylase